MAQDNALKPDGKMWATWGNSGSQSMFLKAAYVQGAIEGLRVGALSGYFTGRLDEKNDAFDYVKPCLDKGPCAGIPVASLIKPSTNDWNELKAGANKVRAGFTPQHASVFDIVHQMDKFYTDYKNTPVCMIVAVQESISSLRGTASTEQELELSRKGCDP
jgi:hypothetical protein